MAQQVQPKGGLGPGFWPVTLLLGIISAVICYIIIVTPASQVLREAAIPADQIDDLFKFCSVFGTIIFVYVTGYLLYFAIAFRRRATDPENAIGIQVHGNEKLELWWTIVPTILIIVLGWFSVKIWYGINEAQGDVLVVEAIGYQFGWQFRYPGLANPVENELHVPINTPITLHTTSKDVIHGFWVPEVRLKYDAVPGLINTFRFTPTIAGQYRIICSEYCGARHGYMVSKFFVDSLPQYQAFISKQKYAQEHAPKVAAGLPPGVNLANGTADAGKAVFAAHCSACHALAPFTQKLVGPGLGKLFNDSDHPKLVNGTAATPEDVAGIIKTGFTGDMGTMPNAQTNQLSNDDIANLVVFLESLSK